MINSAALKSPAGLLPSCSRSTMPSLSEGMCGRRLVSFGSALNAAIIETSPERTQFPRSRGCKPRRGWLRSPPPRDQQGSVVECGSVLVSRGSSDVPPDGVPDPAAPPVQQVHGERDQEEQVDPGLALDYYGANKGLLDQLTKLGHSGSENPNKTMEDYALSSRKG